jgi:CheY-like chemotaxis protein
LSRAAFRAALHFLTSDLYNRERPDLVLTDIIMPDPDGIEVIREIKQIVPTARIIAISGSYLIEKDYCLRMAVQLGAMAVLPKPFTVPELYDLVRQCLGSDAPPRFLRGRAR